MKAAPDFRYKLANHALIPFAPAPDAGPDVPAGDRGSVGGGAVDCGPRTRFAFAMPLAPSPAAPPRSTAPAPEPPAAAPPPRLDARSAGLRLTGGEFDAVTDYDENFLYELTRGVVVVSPIPSSRHEEPIDQLAYLLRKYQYEHPNGAALDRTLPGRYVRVPGGDRRRPAAGGPGDLARIGAGGGRGRRRADGRRRGRVPLPPRPHAGPFPGNRETKRAEYRAAGVKEYWIPDRFADPGPTLTVCAADGSERVVGPAETYETPLLPGFAFRPADVLRAGGDPADP